MLEILNNGDFNRFKHVYTFYDRGVRGQDFKSLAPYRCGFEFHQ